MFVCVCHALSDNDIEVAEANGAKDEKQIFSHYGVEAQCGSCIDSICGLLKCKKRPSETPVTPSLAGFDESEFDRSAG